MTLIRALPRRPHANASDLQRLSHRLVVTAVALRQALAGSALAVQPDGFSKPLIRDALPTQADAGAAQVSPHGRPVQAPAGGERLHVVTCLILRDQFLDLLNGQPALRLSRLRDLSSGWTAAE